MFALPVTTIKLIIKDYAYYIIGLLLYYIGLLVVITVTIC